MLLAVLLVVVLSGQMPWFQRGADSSRTVPVVFMAIEVRRMQAGSPDHGKGCLGWFGSAIRSSPRVRRGRVALSGTGMPCGCRRFYPLFGKSYALLLTWDALGALQRRRTWIM